VAKKTTDKSLEDLRDRITKSLGEGVIGFLNDDVLDVPKLSTGILAVDKITGGGFPKGMFVEISGPLASGKSSIAQRTVAEVQKNGGTAIYIDLENSLDPHMLETAGVDTKSLMVAQPSTSEDTLEVLEAAVSTPDVSLVVVDSVAGMIPRAEMEGDWSDAVVGLQARLMSKGMRRLQAQMRNTDSDVTVIFLNQLRSNIAAMGYGPQTTTTGGKALGFWAATRLEVSRIKNLGTTDNVIGHQVKVKVTKNRHAAPFQVGTFDIYYDSGVSNESTLLDWAVEAGLIRASGSWYSDVETGEKLGQGRASVFEKLSDPEVFQSYHSRLIG
jgi:recombination protein RecA